jgi:hypothetical protein
MSETKDWEGREGRTCGEHRTTGSRAWCFQCSEWCYPRLTCNGCVDYPSILAPIEWALRSGAGMTQADAAMNDLCEQLGVERRSLNNDGGV